jgi:hypothetical protein
LTPLSPGGCRARSLVRFGESWEDRMEEYTVTKFVGFNPEFKRTIAYGPSRG